VALTRRDAATARRLSSVLDALLHLDGEVRRHAEPRFLVEATLTRLAVELGIAEQGGSPQSSNQSITSPQGGEGGRPGRPDGEAEPAPTPLGATAEPAPTPLGATAEPAQTPIRAGSIAGWSDVLEKLNRTVRAAYLDAQPEVDGATLVLWFRYGFHHKKAQEHSAHLMPHVRGWLGDEVKVDYRLRETEPAKGGRPSNSPEDDPFVREVVRRFDGRVTRVKEVTE
jgi:hypothetical protein